MNDPIYTKVNRTYNMQVKRHRRLPGGGNVAYWVRGTIELTIDTEMLCQDMASCLYNKGKKSRKALGAIVARAHSIEEVLA